MGIKRTLTKKTASFKAVITLGEAFDEFMQEKEALNLSKTTLSNYVISQRLFRNFMEYDDSTPLTEINVGDFIHWKRAMTLEGTKPTSINHYLRDCRCFFYWCMDEARKYIETPFKIEMVKGQEEGFKYFEDEDLMALLEKPRDAESFADWRTWAVVNWVLGTGNRAATVCEVRLGDIDYKNKEITLRHTKNKKAQIIPLSPSLETALKQYIKVWRKDAPAYNFLFPNIADEQLTTGALKHAFSKYCKSRGVEQTNIHGLRHNFARNWVKASGSVFVLQKILGHSSLAMTQRYVRLFSDDLKKDFEKYSALDTLKKASKRTMKITRS